jgi:hypothetical protein
MIRDAENEAAKISNVDDRLFKELIKNFPPPPINWKNLIRHATSSSTIYTTTMARPARSTYATGSYIGRLVDVKTPIVLFLIDSSGSMVGEIPSLQSAIIDFMKQVPAATIRIIFWDAAVSYDSGPIKYSGGGGETVKKVFSAFASAGTGGTVISCASQYLKNIKPPVKLQPTDSVIYITDADVADSSNAELVNQGSRVLIVTKTKREMMAQNKTLVDRAKARGYQVIAAKQSPIHN